MPESARWLIANGKLEQAQMYLKKCANMNRREESIHTLKTEVCKLQMIKSREPSRIHYGVIIGTNYTQRRWAKKLKNTVYPYLNVIVGFVLIFTASLQMGACPQMTLLWILSDTIHHCYNGETRSNLLLPRPDSDTWDEETGHAYWYIMVCISRALQCIASCVEIVSQQIVH